MFTESPSIEAMLITLAGRACTRAGAEGAEQRLDQKERGLND